MGVRGSRVADRLLCSCIRAKFACSASRAVWLTKLSCQRRGQVDHSPCPPCPFIRQRRPHSLSSLPAVRRAKTKLPRAPGDGRKNARRRCCDDARRRQIGRPPLSPEGSTSAARAGAAPARHRPPAVETKERRSNSSLAAPGDKCRPGGAGGSMGGRAGGAPAGQRRSLAAGSRPR
jgi:hypothetical protein